jgi:predicted nuclease of predicted toxin-antitoxin system
LWFHAAIDPVIWQRAQGDDSVIITKDEDFVDRCS